MAHDMRHPFAVNTLLDAYRNDDGDGDGGHVQAPPALLCPLLGHVYPGSE